MFLILIMTDEIRKAHSHMVGGGVVRARCYRLCTQQGRDRYRARNTEHSSRSLAMKGRERPWLSDKQVGEGLLFLIIFKDFIIYLDWGIALVEREEWRETRQRQSQRQRMRKKRRNDYLIQQILADGSCANTDKILHFYPFYWPKKYQDLNAFFCY